MTNDAQNTLLSIDELYVFVAVDDQGNEGVAAYYADGMWYPLVAADKARVNSLRNMAKYIAMQTKRKVVLRKFSTKEDLETFH